MGEFYHRVKQFILERHMIGAGEAVVAGVSGGADSLCLLQVLLRLSRETGFFLQVVHVHHGLRQSAEGDLQFVRDLCEREQLPCRCVRVDAAARAAEWGTGVEEAGRKLRYEAFEETRAALEARRGTPCRIAVAHHREDQAETVLFHLCRGTDLRGAGGMLPVSGHIIRPLLMESRAGIEEYLTGLGLQWREDETNADTAYTRNFLRNEIFPRLTAGVNPAAAERISQFASVCSEAERFLEDAASEALERCLAERSGQDFVLSLEALRREDPFLQGRILYRCLADAAGERRDLTSVHVDAMKKLCAGDTDGTLSMPGRITFIRAGGFLFFRKNSPAPKREKVQERDRNSEFIQESGACSSANIGNTVSAGDGIKDSDSTEIAGDGIKDGEPAKIAGSGIKGGEFAEITGNCIEAAGSAEIAGDGIKDGESAEIAGYGIKDGGFAEIAGYGIKDGGSAEIAGDGIKDGEPAEIAGNCIGADNLAEKTGNGICPVETEKSAVKGINAGDAAVILRKFGIIYPLSGEEYECRIFDFDGDLSAIPRNKYTKWFDYDKIGMFPVFRTRQAGDRMTVSAEGADGQPVGRKLARVMLDGKIPAQIRGAIVLPFCGNEALWIPGLRMGERFRITAGTKQILEMSVLYGKGM